MRVTIQLLSSVAIVLAAMLVAAITVKHHRARQIAAAPTIELSQPVEQHPSGSHLDRMIAFASRFAADGYLVNNEEMLTDDAIPGVMLGLRHLHPPDEGEYDIQWRLTGIGDSRDRPRSFLMAQCKGRHTLAFDNRVGSEWDRTLWLFEPEQFALSARLLSYAQCIREEAGKDRSLNGSGIAPYYHEDWYHVVECKWLTGYGQRQLTIHLEATSGEYRFDVIVLDTPVNSSGGPWSRTIVDFTYIGDGR